MKWRTWIGGAGACLVAVLTLKLGLDVSTGLALVIGIILALPTMSALHYRRAGVAPRRLAVLFGVLAVGMASSGVSLMWGSRPVLALLAFLGAATYATALVLVLAGPRRVGVQGGAEP